MEEEDDEDAEVEVDLFGDDDAEDDATLASFVQSLFCLCGCPKKRRQPGNHQAKKTRRPKAAGRSRQEKRRDKKKGQYASLNGAGTGSRTSPRHANVLQLTSTSPLNDL